MGTTDSDADRRPALYGTLVTFLLLNNLAVASRIYANWRTHYRDGRSLFLDDIFLLASGVRICYKRKYFQSGHLLTISKLCVNVIIGNLLACTLEASMYAEEPN